MNPEEVEKPAIITPQTGEILNLVNADTHRLRLLFAGEIEDCLLARMGHTQPGLAEHMTDMLVQFIRQDALTGHI